MPGLAKAKELREERATLIEQARAILDKPEGEDGGLSPEQKTEWNKLHDAADRKKEEFERVERQEREEAELAASRGVEAGRPDVGDPPDPEKTAEEEEKAARKAFTSWLRFGMAGLEGEERKVMETRRRTIQEIPPEVRALASGVDAAGGFTVPEGFLATLIDAEKAFGGMRQSRAEVITTSSGNDLPIPTDDDTSNKGAILAENTQVTEQDVTFGQVVLGAFMYTSKLVRVSIQLLQDSAFDIETWLARKLGERLGRIENEHFTVGTGVSQPNGAVTASTLGATAAAAGAIARDDLVKLKHGVDPAYRLAAQYMFNDTTLRDIKLLKDQDLRPLWQAGMAVGEPDRIDGDPYIVNQDMASIATTAKSVLYGDFSLYKIRDVRDVQVMRLTERYADFLQVGFLAFARRDGDLVDAGTGPVRHLVHP